MDHQRELAVLADEEPYLLVSELEREVRNARRLPLVLIEVICAIAVAAVVIEWISRGMGSRTSGPAIYVWWAGTVLVGVLRAYRGLSKTAASVLAGLSIPQAIGPIAAVWLGTRNPALRQDAAAALERCLPSVDDDRTLTAQHRAALHECLLHCQPPLAEKLLEMFVRIRDTDAIPAVVKMAGGESASAWKLELRAKAQDTFEQLHRIWTADQQRATLLRPAESGAEAGDMLLRAAANHPDDSPVLLRSGEPES